jgi:hypothetical protein
MMYEQHEQTSAPNSVAGGGVHAATALSTSPARQAKMRLDQVVDDARALRADVDSLLYQTGARERADLGKEDRLIAIEEKSTQMTKDLTEVNSRLEIFLGAAKKVDEQMASQQEQLDLMREEIMRMRAKKSASLRDIPSGAFEGMDEEDEGEEDEDKKSTARDSEPGHLSLPSIRRVLRAHARCRPRSVQE